MGNIFLAVNPAQEQAHPWREIGQLAIQASHLYLSQDGPELRGCGVVTQVLSQPILPGAV